MNNVLIKGVYIFRKILIQAVPNVDVFKSKPDSALPTQGKPVPTPSPPVQEKPVPAPPRKPVAAPAPPKKVPSVPEPTYVRITKLDLEL